MLPNVEPQTPQERAKAKRLWNAYRWTWAMYQALGAKQGWKCAICGAGVKNAPLQVDHEHFKIKTHKRNNWHGMAIFKDGSCTPLIVAKTKVAVIVAIKDAALPLSVRGLLCPGRHWGCNRRLGRVDNPDWLEKARNYLLNPPAKDLQF